MKEIGGYFELEKTIDSSFEYHLNAIHLNLGRNALVYLIKTKNIKKIYLPYFLCDSVENALSNLDVIISKYHIDSEFKPVFSKNLGKNEYLYVVNYYGFLSNQQLLNLKRQYKNIIVDNTHAFFRKPVKEVDTIYTCRKYFGVPDGAYLYSSSKFTNIDCDTSKDRFSHLLGRRNGKASDHYGEFKKLEELFNELPLKYMSPETKELMTSINYKDCLEKRNSNYKFLAKELKHLNILSPKTIDGAFCYPLLLKNGAFIRTSLAKKGIYIPKLWPNLKDLNEFEQNCVNNILPLPCDQRYNTHDMEKVANEIKKFYSTRVRELSINDLKIINKWHNNKKLFSYLVGNFYGPSLEEAKNWIDKYLRHQDKTFRGIVSTEKGKDLGIVYLIYNGKNTAEVGIFVAEKKRRNQGYGKSMLNWLLNFGFSVLKFNKIELYVLSKNKNAKKLYSSFGFIHDKRHDMTTIKNKKKVKVTYMYLERPN